VTPPDPSPMIARREHLARYSPRCLKCHDPQVQLTNARAHPAEWRCRMCRHEFFYEPELPAIAGSLGRCQIRPLGDGDYWCALCNGSWGGEALDLAKCEWKSRESTLPRPEGLIDP
jgi:hypothetical protein